MYSTPRISVGLWAPKLSRKKRGDMKCYIPPNELLVHCCTLLGLIQILLNNHKFLKCETSAQNVSFLSQNHVCTFFKITIEYPLLSGRLYPQA